MQFVLMLIGLSLAIAPAPQASLMMTTTGWPDGGDIPLTYTQAVSNAASPGFRWTNVPSGTQSFVFLVHDLDVATNRGTADDLYWLRWNISGQAVGVGENTPAGTNLADGSLQISSGGAFYLGPDAPANGPKHHYAFELFALDTKLDVRPAATAAETRAAIMNALQGRVLAKAVWIGLFRLPRP